jgi:hypothetical protein
MSKNLNYVQTGLQALDQSLIEGIETESLEKIPEWKIEMVSSIHHGDLLTKPSSRLIYQEHVNASAKKKPKCSEHRRAMVYSFTNTQLLQKLEKTTTRTTSNL